LINARSGSRGLTPAAAQRVAALLRSRYTSPLYWSAGCATFLSAGQIVGTVAAGAVEEAERRTALEALVRGRLWRGE
jgi:hypothetical protein